MSDESVRSALRSDAPLVTIEAPAGCGKTHQGCEYATDLEEGALRGRLLILTHTHAACSVFAERTKGISRSRIEIATIDSLIASIAGAYHKGLGLPADIAAWIRQRDDGYGELAVLVSALLRRHPLIAQSAVRRFPTIVCDEHQDSSGDQHALIIQLAAAGARVRVFADPMQRIFRDKPVVGGTPRYDWAAFAASAQAHEELCEPHRWKHGCIELGKWTLKVRQTLKAGGRIDLRALPPSVTVVFAQNQAQANLDFRVDKEERKPIDAFQRSSDSLLVLTRYNPTARAIRAMFFRQLPIWEGHTRPGLEKLVGDLQRHRGDAAAVALALVDFMEAVGIGFSPSAFGNRLVQEVRDGCTKRTSGKPEKIQELARLLLSEPDHHGASRLLRRINELRDTDSSFRDIKVDHSKEFWDGVHLGDYEDAENGLAEMNHRRSYTYPQPPRQAISTIHKAKGLEVGHVIVMPCNAKTFPDQEDARCLLYVALSRAKKRLQLVVSRANPSPLLIF